ncbi:hypothetical protein DVS77_04130 [Mycolicibacterium moriokaense]|nr:hypothetical protein DVS77_04130 [Mycolicibacterium moriokaense]
MADEQDSPTALRLLIGQRRLYSRAKIWSSLRWLGFSAIGIVAPLVAVFIPAAAVAVGALAGIWVFLSRTLFAGWESTNVAKAGALQEDFDCLIFRMPVLAVRTPRPSPEELAAVVGPDNEILATAAKEQLTDWYPFDRDLDGTCSIAIAQRANAAYSERLQHLNARCWLAVLMLWAVVVIALSLAFHVELSTFMLGVVAPLLPAFLDVTDQWRLTKRAGAERRSMADDIERAIRGQGSDSLSSDDLLVWQERLYSLRTSSPLVPNLVYRRARDKNEQAMNTAAVELSAAAKQR